MFQSVKKRGYRRGWPIMGYCGPNGGGKTAAMVWDTLPSLAAGRPVLSTVRLLDWTDPRECPGCDDPDHLRTLYGAVQLHRVSDESVMRLALHYGIAPEDVTEWHARFEQVDANGFPVREVVGQEVHAAAHPLWVPFNRWEQLLDARSCDVLMDEVTGVASSRESQSMPAPVANKLVQLRRADVVVRWSAPSWARADKIIRECSQAVTYCRGHMPVRTGDVDKEWRQRRLFSWKTYDAADFEDFTAGKRESMSSLQRDLHYGPKSPVFSAYDTFDSVLSIGTVTDAGRCYRCGGKREAPRCSCADYQPPTRGRTSRGGAPGATESRGVPGEGRRARRVVADPISGEHAHVHA